MEPIEVDAPWDDPRWLEPSDSVWQRGLRHQQAWWRQERTGEPPGPRSAGDRLVVSMLPLGIGPSPNLMTDEARRSAGRAITDLGQSGRPGMIYLDRLHRNLLSSQPLCFNLFGYLSEHRHALLPWLQRLAPNALEVTSVSLEWAPATGTLGGSAFDAFVVYSLSDGGQGFVGVECKYAEDLSKAQPKKAAGKYKEATRNSDAWISDAETALDAPKLRQFWYNQLLAQAVLARSEFREGTQVVVACDADTSARQATNEVRAQLSKQESLHYCSIEDVLASVEGHDTWRANFRERYLDFKPIQSLLRTDDPRMLTQ